MSNASFNTPQREGTVFNEEAGKLYVYTFDRIDVLQAWPPMAWTKSRKNANWRHYRPESIPAFRIDVQERMAHLKYPVEPNGQMLLTLRPFFERRVWREMNWLKWQALMPKTARIQAGQFTSRRWHILSLLARCGGPAYDLGQSNPALLFALASNWAFHSPAVQRPMRSARELLHKGKSQRDILIWLGFPGTESMRKIMAKIEPAAVSIPRLLELRECMLDQDKAKLLRHLPRINAAVIHVVKHYADRSFTTHEFLEAISHCREDEFDPAVANVIHDICKIHKRLKKAPPRLKNMNSRRLMEIRAVLDEQAERARILRSVDHFPAPPISGTEIIEPITSPRDLVTEGQQQNNCVATYMNKVLRKKVYVYRVHWPERCTLAITHSMNHWTLSELRLARNRPVSQGTAHFVTHWFEQSTGYESPLPMHESRNDLPF